MALAWRFYDQIAFSFKLQGIGKIELFSQGTHSSINLRYESLITVEYQCKEIPLFAFLDIKLWLKEGEN